MFQNQKELIPSSFAKLCEVDERIRGPILSEPVSWTEDTSEQSADVRELGSMNTHRYPGKVAEDKLALPLLCLVRIPRYGMVNPNH
jgi:hypothetical protein